MLAAARSTNARCRPGDCRRGCIVLLLFVVGLSAAPEPAPPTPAATVFPAQENTTLALNTSEILFDPAAGERLARCAPEVQHPFFWETLHEDPIFQFLHRHQHPPDCASRKFLSWPADPWLRGLTQSVASLRHSLLCAVAHGRVFDVLDNSFNLYAHPRYCPSKSFACYAEPLSGCAAHMLGILDRAVACNASADPRAGANTSLEALGDVVFVRQQTPACPEEVLAPLASQLNTTVAGLHQVAQQYLLRPTPDVRSALRAFGRRLNITGPYVSVHIRTGKLFAGHNERTDLHEFMVGYPLHRYAKMVHQVGLALGVRAFFVSIDDWPATEGFASLLHHLFSGKPLQLAKKYRGKVPHRGHDPIPITVHWLPLSAFPLQTIVQRHARIEDGIHEYYNQSVDETVSMLVNIHFLSHGRFYLSTGASQVDVCTRQLMGTGPRASACTWEVIAHKVCHQIGLCLSNWRLAGMWPRD